MPGKHPHTEDPSSIAKTHTDRKCGQKPWKRPLLWPQSVPIALMHECVRLQQTGEITNNELIFQAASQSLTQLTAGIAHKFFVHSLDHQL